jgi:hypothetical protein
MAVNNSRSMNADFHQGSIDCTHIELTPSRGSVENPPVERLSWPTYRNVGRWAESPFLEAGMRHARRPMEIKTSGDSDIRAF